MTINVLKCRTFVAEFSCVILDAKFVAETAIKIEYYDL